MTGNATRCGPGAGTSTNRRADDAEKCSERTCVDKSLYTRQFRADYVCLPNLMTDILSRLALMVDFNCEKKVNHKM